MKAVRFHEYGAPDVLRHEDAERPVPGPGEALIRVAATSFNPVDAGIRAGERQGPFPIELPHVPGTDVAGTVEELGEGPAGIAVGDDVVGFLPIVPDGASAEYVVAPVEVLTKAPAAIPLGDAAALPTVGLAAWQALFEHGGLKAGQTALVNGAGGAVGSYAVQLAKHAGATVFATAGPRSAARVEAAGADRVIDHTTTSVAAALDRPVDLVLNLAPIEPKEFDALPALVADGGVVVSTTLWMPAPSDEARGVRGIDVVTRSDAGDLARLVELIDAGELRVEVAERVPLVELAAVHTRAAAGELAGKVVITVGA
jgi:NADPH:quinone reductase-like Zn-dependent oxidoreductase